MGQAMKLISLLKSSSNFFLFLLLTLCLVIYLYLPAGSRFVPQLLTTIDIGTEYKEDPRQLIDLHGFDYIIRQNSCASHVQALVVVHSAPANFEKRAVIRKTWGSDLITNRTSPLRLLFLVGMVADYLLQSSLLAEHSLHGDLLQGNFQDSYFNLTYKHVMALKWFTAHCEPAHLLIKVDDDIYVNTPLVLHHLNISSPPSDSPLSELFRRHKELLLCSINMRDRVIRSYFSKWRVSVREYPDRYYPPFCPGFAIFYSSDVVRRLYSTAQRTSFFRLDDVLVTGILSKRSNITLTDLTSYVLYPDRLNRLLSGRSEFEEFLVSWHKMSSQQIRGLWQLYGITD